MSKSTGNEKDYLSVTLGLVHNIGAGGVSSIGGTFRPSRTEAPSGKRSDQWYRRMDRAVGDRR